MSESEITRREFLQAGAVAGTGVALGRMTPGLLGQAVRAGGAPIVGVVAPVTGWASKTMRWAQLTLVEDDPAHFDPAFWFDYFKKTRSDGVCLSGGGCVAYYPTEVPFHHRSAWLGDRDVLGELVTGCRKLEMAVLIRTDPHATYEDAKTAHPDWIAVEANGQPRRHWSSPEMWVTCALGPYNFEFMTAVHKEIMTKYRPDGIFMNRWDGSGDCFCVHCKENFKGATGLELTPEVARGSARRAFVDWRRGRLVEVLDVWNAEIRAINSDSSVVPNNGGGAGSPLDAIETSKRAPMLAADRQARNGLEAPWMVGKSGKEYRAAMGDKAVIGLFGIGLEEAYRWKDSVTSNTEIRIWALDAIANGMRPWFTKFSATLHDQRWLKEIEDIYVWTEKNQRYLAERRPMVRVGLVYSQQTAWYSGAKVEDYALGWYQAMVESRVQFEMVHDRLMDAEHLAGFKTLILPNLVCMSDAQCEQLRAFVAKGGSIIATHETSLDDEKGLRRKNFGLADMFGVDWTGKTQGPMLNSYIRLEHEALPGSEWFAGLEDAPRVINGVTRLEVTPREKFAETPFTLIPSYPDLPMEKVYPRVVRTDTSCLYARQVGAGRVAYFPFDIDRTFWEVLCGDHLKMLRNTLAWANDETPAVEVDGPGLLDVTAWRNAAAITVHLVNMTNPMAMKGPYRDFFTVGPHTVRVHLPDGVRAKRGRLLAADKDVAIEQQGSTVSVTVASILDHEVVAIEV